MEEVLIAQAIALLEKANVNLEPELLEASAARRLLSAYARVEKLGAFGVAALSRKVRDSAEVAHVTGTSMGKAKAVVATGEVLATSGELDHAMRTGRVSGDQGAAIASAEQFCPGAARELLDVAQKESFHVLRDKARKAKLEAEQHRDLARRQHDARSARSYSDELGMVHLHVSWEPHVGTPIVARAEAEAARIARKARAAATDSRTTETELFERYLADAYACLLSGGGKGPARRPELVVLVSHEVAKRGWNQVREGELCKIPGVGPVAPQVAKEIAKDAFLSGVFHDGTDLRNLVRWSRSIPVEVALALELGEPPGFDGVSCVDCGNRFRTEFDHVRPRFKQGPTSQPNLKPRCWSCHQAKTKRERKAARARPPDP